METRLKTERKQPLARKLRAIRSTWLEANRGKVERYFQSCMGVDPEHGYYSYLTARERNKRLHQHDNPMKDTFCMDCGHDYSPEVMEFDVVWEYSLPQGGSRCCTKITCVVCAACQSIRSLQRNPHPPLRSDFDHWVDSKKASPCIDCGEVLPPEAMSFSHAQGEKVVSITPEWWNRSRAEVEAEVEKCEVVCVNCHRTRTVEAL